MVASSAPPRSDVPRNPGDEQTAQDPDHRGTRRSSRTGLHVAIGVAVVGSLLLLVALVAPRWFTDDSSSPAAERSDAMRQAEDWIGANVRGDDHLVVDAAAADDLLTRGISYERLVPIGASGPTPDALASWQQDDYLVSSPAIRARLAELPSVQQALDSSIAVAAFGEGDQRVEIRRILSGGMADAQAKERDAQHLRLGAGGSLATNPNLTASADSIDALEAGQVDERLLNVIATLVVQHHLQIGAFPTVDGEDGIGAPRRIVEVDGIDFQTISAGTPAVASLEAFLDSQLSSYRPVDVAIVTHPSGTSSLRITYGVADPSQ